MTTHPNWHTSSYTKSDTCVEVADNDPARVMIRDTKDRERGTMGVRPAPWAAFVDHAKGLLS
ncbi:DUF397 domain-containing protein [Streptomyces sp. NBC_00102]|uniref:DUF397 domain-containing protein n=1 Tax=Streptomyces sp. NBC_00102 TaxID=2975652 RepID=UPI002255FAE0|nr:DUF397 domain-containing protein [Streptomyces sp. NBC_00102]MCX5395968.1 DUF397 domain-containing protein [Streptomyces sp. NBC_00102]